MCFSFADPHTFQRHFHLVNQVDLETVLQVADFVNDGDGQVRAAHKILGYAPLQKSFADPRHVISDSHPWLPKIIVVESGFLISKDHLSQRASHWWTSPHLIKEQRTKAN